MGYGRNDVIFLPRAASIAAERVILANPGLASGAGAGIQAPSRRRPGTGNIAGFRIKPGMAGGIRLMSFSMIVFLLLIFPLATSFGMEGQVLRPTSSSMDFYGYIEGANSADELTVYDGQGVLSGRFIIKDAGRYGFLHVYGDDRATAVDEGASLNESLSFYLNGAPLLPLSVPEVLWLGDSQRLRVDFNRR